jgi:hypothetical protein
VGRGRPVAAGCAVAIAALDPIDTGLVTLVDIEGAPFSRAVLEFDLPPARRANASPGLGSRSAARSTSTSKADTFGGACTGLPARGYATNR